MKLGEAIERGYAKDPSWGKSFLYNPVTGQRCAIGLMAHGLGLWKTGTRDLLMDIVRILGDNNLIDKVEKLNDRKHIESYEDMMLELKTEGYYDVELEETV